MYREYKVVQIIFLLIYEYSCFVFEQVLLNMINELLLFLFYVMLMEGHAETEDWEAMDIFESILLISKL